MHRLTSVMCWLILGTGLVPPFAQPAEEAQNKLQGTWTATEAERDGKAAEDIVGNRLSFTGNRFQIRSKHGRPLYEGIFRLDPSAKPAAIDFEHTEGALKGKVWKGIYAVDGDTLTTCDDAPDLDKGRPAAFKAKSGSAYILITFRRAKPRDPASDQRELTQLVQDLNGALVQADIAFLEHVLHEDYTHHRPRGTVEDRAQYLENRKARRVDFESLVAEEVKVRLYGDTAVVTYRSTAQGKDQQGAIDEQRRWTRVFVWQDGRWQLVHSQRTTLQKPSGMTPPNCVLADDPLTSTPSS
jgi:uncharacterized protein (TIGR03067 family)